MSTTQPRSVPKVTTCLWFDTESQDAAEFYTSIFKNSAITDITHFGSAGPRPEGMVMTVSFNLDGVEFLALNGGEAGFRHSEAVSFVIDCEDQAEIDHFWGALADGGEEGPCGWLKDKFGVSWQVVPRRLEEMIRSDDREAGQRAMAAMLQMGKLDLEQLERAYAGA